MLCLFTGLRPQVGLSSASLRMLREHLRCCLISQCLEEGACGGLETPGLPQEGVAFWDGAGVWSVLVKTTQDTSPAPIFRGGNQGPKMEKCFLRSHHNLETSHLFLSLFSFPAHVFICLFVCFLLSHICVLPQVTGDSVVSITRPCRSNQPGLSSVPSAITLQAVSSNRDL